MSYAQVNAEALRSALSQNPNFLWIDGAIVSRAGNSYGGSLSAGAVAPTRELRKHGPAGARPEKGQQRSRSLDRELAQQRRKRAAWDVEVAEAEPGARKDVAGIVAHRYRPVAKPLEARQ